MKTINIKIKLLQDVYYLKEKVLRGGVNNWHLY